MKNKWLILVGLLGIAAAVWLLVLIPKSSRILEIDFLDVGQGDAILIRTPKGQTMLIDGGPDNGILEKLGKYLQPLQKRIDIIILTHPHADHVSGLIEVLRRYSVGLVILNGVYLKTDNYDQFLSAIKDNKVKILIAQAGEAVHFDELAGGLEFDIIAPDRSLSGLVFNKNSESFGTVGNDLNDTSIVGKLIYNNFSIMFMADATSKIENQLLAYGNNLKSDVLKVGHHGSKYSSFTNFLKTVAPKVGVIEVGAKNFYGLPSLAALSRLKMFNINIFRTDQGGDIQVLSDGFTTNIYTQK